MAQHTAIELARLIDATLVGDGSRILSGAASLADASAEDVSFLIDPRYMADFEASRAGAVIVPEDFEPPPGAPPLLKSARPNRAFSMAVEAFALHAPPVPAGVHETAVVEEGVELSEDVGVGALAYVGQGARLASGVRVHPGAVVGAGAQLGCDTEVHPRAVVYPHVRIGERCVLHAGVVIGADGFGFERVGDAWEKVPQGGSVIIEDDVEIGANSTVDRARVGVTRVGKGAKLDNLIHLGHNVHLGQRTLMAGQSGIAGSTRVGDDSMFGGQVGVAGHLTLGKGVQVAGKAAVFDDQEDGAKIGGWPARPFREFVRIGRSLVHLLDLPARLRAIDARLAALEKPSD